VPVPAENGIDFLRFSCAFFGVESVGDENTFDAQTRAQIFDDRLGHADDRVGLSQDMTFNSFVETALNGEGPRRARRLERPAIAKLCDPRDSAAFEGEADQMS
jgi:hypothetical protein